jgi:2,5-diamino-6-(ribosylamino)-4(3H)-pyrimidinone 5'-phosphate reductase
MISTGEVYAGLTFPEAPAGRPYTFINMVSTIDGKTVTGTDQEPVGDLGSQVDHLLMRRIESAADAILIGAGALRSTPGLWYPKDKWRFVLTRSGELDYASRFFTDAPEKVGVLAPADVSVPSAHLHLSNDVAATLDKLRNQLGITHLLIEGGSEINAEFLRLDLVDELFLTLAPKIKLGNCLPTYAGGQPLDRQQVQNYDLLEHHQVGSELFLRYRRVQS